MIFWVTLKVSLRSLWANRLRSLLAMLGIVIGVSTVMLALALVGGVRESVISRISALGSNLLVISPGERGTAGVVSGTQRNLKVGDMLALFRDVPSVRQIAPVVRGQVQVKYLGHNSRTTIIGTSATYFSIRNCLLNEGKYFNDAQTDAQARVAVIGPTTAEHLFGPRPALEQVIKLDGIGFRVIGVLKSKGDQGFFNPDDQVFVPYTVAMKQVLGLDYLQELDAQTPKEAALDACKARIERVLRRRHRLGPPDDNDFNLRTQEDILQTVQTVSATLSLLSGGMAGISLLVGGIGIMNIMLVSVAERTREIGIRKAIGARQRDILLQFLIEAVVMSGTGGLIGIAVGFALAFIVGLITSLRVSVSPAAIAMGLGCSAGVGIFFGFYPARAAARLDPIEALRYE